MLALAGGRDSLCQVVRKKWTWAIGRLFFEYVQQGRMTKAFTTEHLPIHEKNSRIANLQLDHN